MQPDLFDPNISPKQKYLAHRRHPNTFFFTSRGHPAKSIWPTDDTPNIYIWLIEGIQPDLFNLKMTPQQIFLT